MNNLPDEKKRWYRAVKICSKGICENAATEQVEMLFLGKDTGLWLVLSFSHFPMEGLCFL